MTSTLGIEQFLARAFEGLRNRAGESGDQAGAEHADTGAETDIAAAPGDAARRRHHDADDQAGFDDFAKTMMRAPSMVSSAFVSSLKVRLTIVR